ncbi:hypothetical protein [Kribbella sp. NPDC000426]|uniref:hypothetical protein n=1 Tax=Kribbella sp. NPDC000426 TaxID=3154255 RepID=UPI0033231789
MEHPSGTTLGPTPGDQTAAANAAPVAPVAAVAAPVAERRARADWLITELSRLAAQADDPRDQARYRRTADSLVRLAIAFRS